jgi:nitroreductase
MGTSIGSPSLVIVLVCARLERFQVDRCAVDVIEAIKTRRTHKSFGPEPVSQAELEELFDLARFVPNHHLTQPWRFRVLGPRALARLKEAAGPADAPKLDRAPTLVVASARLGGDEVQDEEDLHAAAAAVYAVLLGAHARGLAGYWRSPAVLRTPAGREAVGIPADEHVVGLIHLGPARVELPLKEREPVSSFLSFLD